MYQKENTKKKKKNCDVFLVTCLCLSEAYGNYQIGGSSLGHHCPSWYLYTAPRPGGRTLASLHNLNALQGVTPSLNCLRCAKIRPLGCSSVWYEWLTEYGMLHSDPPSRNPVGVCLVISCSPNPRVTTELLVRSHPWLLREGAQ